MHHAIQLDLARAVHLERLEEIRDKQRRRHSRMDLGRADRVSAPSRSRRQPW